MIFVTTGTEKFPFNRLLRTIDKAVESGAITDKVFAQTGSSDYAPRNFPYERFLDYHEQVKRIGEADIVVSHAGEGSIITCLNLGKVPVVFPRNAAYGEHVDDHQGELARKMGEHDRVIAAYNEEELVEKIRNYESLVREQGAAGKNRCRQTLVKYLRAICSKREKAISR